MAKTIDKQTMLGLIVEAKRTDPETGSFAEWLAEYLVDHLPTLTPPNEWISVSDKLPEEKEYVLIAMHDVIEVARIEKGISQEERRKMKSGEITTIIVNDVANIQQLCSQTIFSVFLSFIRAIPLALYMLFLSPLLFLIIVIVQPLFLILQNRVAKRTQSEAKTMRDTYSQYNSFLQKYLYCIFLFRY